MWNQNVELEFHPLKPNCWSTSRYQTRVGMSDCYDVRDVPRFDILIGWSPRPNELWLLISRFGTPSQLLRTVVNCADRVCRLVSLNHDRHRSICSVTIEIDEDLARSEGNLINNKSCALWKILAGTFQFVCWLLVDVLFAHHRKAAVAKWDGVTVNGDQYSVTGKSSLRVWVVW